MEQHVRDRDYSMSRNVIEQVRQWQEQSKGSSANKISLDEFEKDPLGEKKRLANIANLNNDLKGERYENRLN